MTVSVRDVVAAGKRAGLRITGATVHLAVTWGELEPLGHSPLTFAEKEANRWLNDLARRQRVEMGDDR
jgi:hypothetical protein